MWKKSFRMKAERLTNRPSRLSDKKHNKYQERWENEWKRKQPYQNKKKKKRIEIKTINQLCLHKTLYRSLSFFPCLSHWNFLGNLIIICQICYSCMYIVHWRLREAGKKHEQTTKQYHQPVYIYMDIYAGYRLTKYWDTLSVRWKLELLFLAKTKILRIPTTSEHSLLIPFQNSSVYKFAFLPTDFNSQPASNQIHIKMYSFHRQRRKHPQQ